MLELLDRLSRRVLVLRIPALRVLKNVLPGDLIWRPIYGFQRRLFHRHMRKRLGPYFKVVEPGPAEPREIRLKTAALNRETFERPLSERAYHAVAYRTVYELVKALERGSGNLRTIGAILELGCGGARLLRHFRCMDGVRLVGTDLDGDMVEWCRRNIPGPEFYVNSLRPPLPFAEDEAFDLILAQSVFTHIPLALQARWLEEMKRVLRPGGIFLSTVLGKHLQGLMLGPTEVDRLYREGHLTLNADDPRASLSTQVIGSWDVFQTCSEVIGGFGALFEVCDYLPGRQDLLILRKPRPPLVAGTRSAVIAGSTAVRAAG